MKTASSAYSNQRTRNDERFDANDANPESRTGILRDTSSGKLERESEDDYACPGMLKLNDAFNKIGDVMTSLQERSSDSVMTNDERNELVLELSRSLWSLHLARSYVNEMDKENKSLNLASAPRSTEIDLSHGHATLIKKHDGTLVPSAEVDLAEGQYERSIQDTIDVVSDAEVYEVELKDLIQNEMLKSIMPCSQPKGSSEVLFLDDSSDVGSLDINGVLVDLSDGDLASADLQPGHLVMSKRDRRMMMNGHESEHVQNTCRTRAEHVGDRAPMSGSMVNHGWAEGRQRPCHPPRTSRSGLFNGSGKFYGSDVKPGFQPGYCCLTTDVIQDDYHSPQRSISYRSGGTTQQIASALNNDCACVFDELNTSDVCAMAPDLLRWGDDLISVPADYNGELFEQEFTGVSESDDARVRTTPKDKFTSSIIADKSYLSDFKIIPPSLQVSAINNYQEKSCKFTHVP